MLIDNQDTLITGLSADQIALARQSKLTTMGQMASSIAHEINNPLSVIRMNAELLLSYCEDSTLPEKARERCQRIIATSDRISGIIRALKAICANSPKPNFQTTQLASLIDDIHNLCSNRFKTENIPLEINIDEIRDMSFSIDASQISQAIINLLNNSVDAIQNQSEKWVKFHGYIHNDKLCLSVTDSGHGISEEVLKNILTPFYSTKLSHKGLGIGLNLVQSYAAFHEGVLNYALVDGHTTFVLELPLSKVQVQN